MTKTVSPNDGTSFSPEPPEIGMSPAGRAGLLLGWIRGSVTYSRRKRTGFRRASSALKVGILALTGASTIILGAQNLDFWTGLGFALVALATVASAVEPFFAWRSRWVLMEEQLHRFYRLDEDFRMTLATEEPTHAIVDRFYAEYRGVWTANSQRWLEFRRSTEQG